MIRTYELKEIFMDCLFNEDELVNGVPTIEPVYVNGVLHNIGFHPDRLESHRNDIQTMVDQLGDSFTVGDSFLNMCIDKNGNHWGEHISSEQLLTLSLGLQIIEYVVDPEQAKEIMPSSMPLIRRKDNSSTTHSTTLFNNTSFDMR